MADHYETLGVPPTASEREIKKAYFALVRQFPPETHAEDFRRIREAYEALSNPETRAEHDRARAAGGTVEPFSEHGPELGAQLRAAATALNQDKPKEAIPVLESAVTAYPDIIVARDMLGVALMMAGDMRRASQEFEELTRRDPTNPVFHIRLGHTYRDLKFDRPALAAYLKARELAPTEVAIRFVISDFHASRKRWKEALKELDEAAALSAGRADRDWEPALRRVSVQLTRKKSRLARSELSSLISQLPADEEVRKYIADRLSSMAARAFALQQPREGNHLLEVARSLKPERQLGSFPRKVKVPFDLLPEATRKWLLDQPNRSVVKPLWSRGYTQASLILALSLLLLGIGALTVLSAFETTEAWSAGGWSGAALLVAAGVWAVIGSVRHIIRTRRSPLGRFTTLHSHYLVEVHLDEVTFWPLINLTRISTVHQHTYAVYTASTVKLLFGPSTVTLSIRGKQVAEGLANEAAQLRGRVLDLLASGMLEADGEVDLVPRALRSGGGPKVPLDLKKLRLGASCAAAAAVAVLALSPIQMRAMERTAWESARLGGATSIRAYMDAHPDGRYAAEARAALDHELERGLHRLQQMHQAQAAVLGELLEALRRAGTNQVRVEYTPSLDLDDFRAPDSFNMAQVTLTERDVAQRHRRITEALQRRVDVLLGPHVVELRDIFTRTAAAPSPVKLQVSSVLGLSGEVYQLSFDPSRRYFGLVLRSAVDLRLEGDAAPAHHYDLAAAPDRELRWTEDRVPTAKATYGRMADAAADELGHLLAVAMQLDE